ncbi:hypothetical protein ABH925_004939 [Streptacidiphilus sp. EB129]
MAKEWRGMTKEGRGMEEEGNQTEGSSGSINNDTEVVSVYQPWDGA